jgi:hypothetical protein
MFKVPISEPRVFKCKPVQSRNEAQLKSVQSSPEYTDVILYNLYHYLMSNINNSV